MLMRVGILLLLAVASSPLAHAQTYFAGGLGGIATLSADGQTSITTDFAALSSYRPLNGPAINIFAGAHLNDFLSLQGNYIWNRNEITVASSASSSASTSVYEEKRRSSQTGVILDVLLYFRNRESWVRPYLSAGGGVVRFESDHRELLHLRGSAVALPAEFVSSKAALRVAVGVDIAIGRGFSIRYSFSETIRENPVSSRLSPAGERNLANFQNLFGIVKSF
jgi:hypothetical protein